MAARDARPRLWSQQRVGLLLMESPDTPGGDLLPALPDAAQLSALAKGFLGIDVDKLHAELQAKLEAKSEELRQAILKCSPTGLLGFLWSQLALSQMLSAEEEGDDAAGDKEGNAESTENSARPGLDDLMFAMEYVHAVLSSHPAEQHGKSTADADVNTVAALAEDLRSQALMYCLIAAKRLPDDVFGPDTGEVAMQAMTTWVTVRGHRYQALETKPKLEVRD